MSPLDPIRCAWCAARAAPQTCEACGAPMVARERYGAARFLKRGGVDKYALPARAAALDLRLAAELGARHDAQWAAVRPRVAEARTCESALIQRGFLARVEDELAVLLPFETALPGGWSAPAREDLREIELGTPLDTVRLMAGLARLRQRDVPWGRSSPEAMLAAGEPFATELALIARARDLPHDDWIRRLEPLLRAALEQRALAPYAAVALHSIAGETGLEADLRAGLSSRDLSLRLECALALAQEDVLFDLAIDRGAQASEALAGLSRAGSRHAADLLHHGDPDQRRILVRALRGAPRGAVLAGYLVALPELEDHVRRESISRLTETAWAGLDGADQLQWKAFSDHPGLPARDLLELVEWVADDAVAAAPFITAALEALRVEDPASAKDLLHLSGFRALLLAVEPAHEPLLASLALDAELARPFWDACFWLHGTLQRDHEDRRGVDLIERVWAACGARRTATLETFAKVVRSNTGVSGAEWFVEWIWLRFRAFPEEREQLLTAFSAWRNRILERRDADPDAPGGTDPIARLRVWAVADPAEFIDHATQAIDAATVAELVGLSDALFELARACVAHRPRSAIVAVFRLANRIADEAREDLARAGAAIERLEAGLPLFEKAFLQAVPESSREAGAEHFLEDIAVRRRLIDEARERDRESRRRVDAALRRSPEPVPEPEPVRLPAIEPVAPPPVVVPRLRPRIELTEADSEHLLPGTALPSLLDYVHFLKSLQGPDTLAVFSAHGLEIKDWPPLATRWSALLMARSEVALRMATLLSSEWAPVDD